MARKTSLGIQVSLTDAEANAIAAAQPPGMSTHEQLGRCATIVLSELAKGAILIPADYAARVRQAIDTDSPIAVVEHVESAVNRQGEAVIVPWVVDPTQVQYYRELAENNGMTLERQLKAVMDYAFSEGWLGSGVPITHYIMLDSEQYRKLQDLFKKDVVNGEDVVNAAVGNLQAIEFGAPPAPVDNSEPTGDPVIDSLTA